MVLQTELIHMHLNGKEIPGKKVVCIFNLVQQMRMIVQVMI
jgi:hypothetical protein